MVVLSAQNVGAGLLVGEENENVAKKREPMCKGGKCRSVICTTKAPS